MNEIYDIKCDSVIVIHCNFHYENQVFNLASFAQGIAHLIKDVVQRKCGVKGSKRYINNYNFFLF